MTQKFDTLYEEMLLEYIPGGKNDPAMAKVEEEEVAEKCDTPGKKIKSDGKGKGLAKGDGNGPIGEPSNEEDKTGEKVKECKDEKKKK
jgi:hypothetical protein